MFKNWWHQNILVHFTTKSFPNKQMRRHKTCRVLWALARLCFPSSLLLNFVRYTLLKGTLLLSNCPAVKRRRATQSAVSKNPSLAGQPCDMIYVGDASVNALTVTSRPSNWPQRDTSETDYAVAPVCYFHPFPLLIFMFLTLSYLSYFLFSGSSVSAHRSWE